MIEDKSICTYFQNLFANLCSQDNLITINIGNQKFTTSRPLLISHSQELEEIFGDNERNQFTLYEDLDPDAFGQFINFVNSRSISFNQCSFGKLLEIYQFCKAQLFRDYLAINAPTIDLQFNFLSSYDNENLPTEFLIIKLASQIKTIIKSWDNVHNISSVYLIRVLEKADLSHFAPNELFDFINDTIVNRKDDPSGVINTFNLTLIPLDDLLKLQSKAEEYNVFIPFLIEIKMNKDYMEHLTQESGDMLDKVSYITFKNVKMMSSIEFRMINSFRGSTEFQAVTKLEQDKITFSLLLIGKENVGKTSLLNRFFTHKFSENKITQTTPNTHYNYNSEINNIDIFDIDGLSSFDNIRDIYIFKSQFFLFICSLDVENSIEYIENYYRRICQLRGTSYVPSIICLNKIDLFNSQKTKYLYIKNFALSINSEFFETSAKTGENVNLIFDVASKKYSKHSYNSPIYISKHTENQ